MYTTFTCKHVSTTLAFHLKGYYLPNSLTFKCQKIHRICQVSFCEFDVNLFSHRYTPTYVAIVIEVYHHMYINMMHIHYSRCEVGIPM